MISAGLEELKIYISRGKNKVAQYIYTRPIMYLCLESEKCLGALVAKQCW